MTQWLGCSRHAGEAVEKMYRIYVTDMRCALPYVCVLACVIGCDLRLRVHLFVTVPHARVVS